MPGSTDVFKIRTRKVEGVCGTYIGVFPLALSRDMDPTNRITYLEIGNVDYPSIPKGNGVCRLLSHEATERAKRVYKES